MPPARSSLALAALAALAATAAAGAAVDPPARPQTKLEKAATILVGNAAPFILRASVLNAENPIWMSTLCDQPYVGGVDPLSLSRPATDWVLAIQKKNGDGYNGTVALPLQFFAKCEINSAGKPECAFVFDSHPKLTGLATVAKAPAGVNLTGCTLYMDGSTATSSDCWNGANPLKSEVVTLASAAPEGAIIAINITVNAVDTATGTPFTGEEEEGGGQGGEGREFRARRRRTPSFHPPPPSSPLHALPIRVQHLLQPPPLQPGQPGCGDRPARAQLGPRRGRVWRVGRAARQKPDDGCAGRATKLHGQEEPHDRAGVASARPQVKRSGGGRRRRLPRAAASAPLPHVRSACGKGAHALCVDHHSRAVAAPAGPGRGVGRGDGLQSTHTESKARERG